MEFNLKTFTSTDIYTMTDIISDVGVEQFDGIFNDKAILSLVQQGELSDTIGYRAILKILAIVVKNLSKCKKNLNLLLSSVSGIEVKDLEVMSAVDYIDLITAIKNMDGFKDFFTHALKLLNMDK